MDEILKNKLDIFADNYLLIKNEFIMQYSMTKRLASLLYAAAGKKIDVEAIRESYQLIKEQTGFFSMFRGISVLSISAMLALSDDKEKLFSNTLKAYEMMKDSRFHATDYLTIAAFQLASASDPGNYTNVIERSRAFYEAMKKEHWFLTGSDDYIFCIMLGLSDVEVDLGIVQMEKLYNVLKPEFFSSNSVQGLTHVLVLGGDDTAVNRVFELNRSCRNRGIRLDRQYTLASLGVLSLLSADVEDISGNVLDSYDYLRTKKGFGSLSLTKQELLLLASALVSYRYMDDLVDGITKSVLSTSISNIIIAQQTAIIAAAAASSAAASSASH